MYPYAMCQQCDWGNVDCSYANHPECWGIEWSNHAQDPLRCVPCAHCEAGCCRGAQGYEPEWVDLADAFSSTVTKLYADSTAKNLLKNAIAAIPTKALQHRHRQQNTALSTAWQLLYETVYEHVANYAVRHLGQAIAEKIRSHPPAQTCPNVLRPLNDAEAAGICNVLLVTSKCAAGDIVARKPGSKHYAFLSMLEGVAAALGFCLLVWDMASRLGPCCRQKTSERGGCANLTAAELELEADAHAAMLKVFEAVAEGSVRSIRCWKHTGGDAARFACWVTHYRYLFNPMGYLLDDPLYRLARAHHLIGWLAAVFGEDRAWRADVYMRALALLPEELRRIYASPAEVEGATTEQWVEATDLWGPYLLPGRYELTREDRVKGGRAGGHALDKCVRQDIRLPNGEIAIQRASGGAALPEVPVGAEIIAPAAKPTSFGGRASGQNCTLAEQSIADTMTLAMPPGFLAAFQKDIENRRLHAQKR